MRGVSGHPTTGPVMAYCIMKAVANMDNQGLDEHRSARIMKYIPEKQYCICKGLS
jgi:hypothetical protein